MCFIKASFVALLVLFSSHVFAATPKLVGADRVEEWGSEVFNTLNCVVSLPINREVAAQSGALLSYVASVGKSFTKGDLLAKQDSFLLSRELQRVKLDLETAKLEAGYNEQEFNRLSLLGDEWISQSRLTLHDLNKNKTFITIKRLENEIQEKEELLKRLEFFAEADGHVVEVNAAVGAFVNLSESIASFYFETDKEISCLSPINQSIVQQDVPIGQFFLAGGEPLEVKRLGKKINESSQNRTIYLKIPEESLARLEIGRRLKVSESAVVSAGKALSKLPADALTMSSGGKHVWLISEEGLVSKVDVKVVSNLPDYFVVESDLKPGDRVVTVGKGGLKNDQRVSFGDRDKIAGAERR